MTTWATIEDVADVTGEAVDDRTLRVAEAMIATFAGRDPETAVITRASDLRQLRLAVCWQAAYVKANDDVLERVDVEQEHLGLHGLRTMNRADASSIVIAPLARMALRRVSWLRPRATRVLSLWERHARRDLTSDDALPWKPMP